MKGLFHISANTYVLLTRMIIELPASGHAAPLFNCEGGELHLTSCTFSALDSSSTIESSAAINKSSRGLKGFISGCLFNGLNAPSLIQSENALELSITSCEFKDTVTKSDLFSSASGSMTLTISNSEFSGNQFTSASGSKYLFVCSSALDVSFSLEHILSHFDQILLHL